MAHTYKTDLEEYIFTRPEMAKLLGISTNALRMRMKKGRCTLDYRFDGKKFLFKRPRDIKVHRPPLDPPKNSHEKALRDYDRKVQKRYNRGSTHREHGGEPSRKGNYTQQSFKHHNELKIMNSLQGKYQNDAQRREFENMNEEALKEANKRAKDKAVFNVPDNPRPGRLGVRLKGEIPHYGNMLNAEGLQRIQDNEDKNSLLDFERDTAYSQKREGHDYYRPFASTDSSFYLNPAYDPANINNSNPDGGVEFDNNHLENYGGIQERRSDSFGSKVEESIYRAKKHLLKTKGSWD
jgi:hypothetical protein